MDNPPSGDMPNETAQEQSFSLANVVPQTARLNRGIWEGVETAVRNLAMREGRDLPGNGPSVRRQRAAVDWGRRRACADLDLEGGL